MDDEEQSRVIHQILMHIAEGAEFLQPGSKAREALPVLDMASKLADQLQEKQRGFYAGFVDVHREYALGLAEQQEGTDLDSVLLHFQTALDCLQRIREEYQDLAKEREDDLDKFGNWLKMKYYEIQLPQSPGESPRDAEARRRRLIEDTLEALSPGYPSRRLLEGVKDFNDALQPFREAVDALIQMNLEDATRHIENASRLVHNAEDAWSRDDNPQVQPLKKVGSGFRMLIDAQRSYVSTLKDAVVGDVTNKHVAALTVADNELAEGLKLIETWWLPEVVKLSPQRGESLDIPTLRDAVSRHREILRNFRALVREGTRARQVLLGATPKFVVYFVISFLVVLFGSRWSGLVPQLDVGSVAGIAVTVSVFSAYGFDAGKQVLSMIWSGSKSGVKQDAD